MTTEKRPVIKLQLSFFDKIIEAFTLLLLLATWIYVFILYSRLPDSIPTHFSINGKPNAFGHKSDLYQLLTVLTSLYILLSIAARFPQYFSYLKPVTPESAKKQYTLATRILRYLKVLIVLIFAAFVFITTRY
ncbi:DUF1648 domain-containing protein [Pedobacter caeni]|uniref:DUF1648 domain-containing protein n=1 Tax=Pedobacter caeni TaxID=288992 RepID=A0A1M5PG47_9SPHI|nr:DUF1648 domain-containing protein [Pedobacter caeni]SHH00233.1 Protein of unknown function [Pedobacter caeni]